MNFGIVDVIVFGLYCFFIIGLGLWVSRNKAGQEKSAEDYFLASKSLPWWAIGASLIASNISAEQFIGMAGSGYVLGMAIAAYELMAAITLVIVGKYFLPIFLEKKIFTMPQFLNLRYDHRVRTSLAVFWLALYIFVNLTSVLYLGAISLETVIGVDITVAIVGLAAFSLLYSIYGGLAAVAWTDVVQVIFLVIGGLITSYLALDLVSDGQGFFSGVAILLEHVPQKFDMIFEQGSPHYDDLPGVSLLIGGMWIANLSYWGCNQYITQRALAGKSLSEAQNGIIFAGFLKMLMPFIVVIPGIAAYYLYEQQEPSVVATMLGADGLPMPDKSYPTMLALVPIGLKGITFAALIGAIVSSLSSMMNSASTIFTMDIYRNFIDKEASDKSLVRVGRWASVAALVVAALVAPALGSFKQIFQYVQEFSGLVTPGVFVIFVFGLFWRKSTANAALTVALLTFPISFGLKLLFPELPFLDRMGVTGVSLSFTMICVSVWDSVAPNKMRILAIVLGLAVLSFALMSANEMLIVLDASQAFGKTFLHFLVLVLLLVALKIASQVPDNEKSIHFSTTLFDTKIAFNLGALVIVSLLVLIYYWYW